MVLRRVLIFILGLQLFSYQVTSCNTNIGSELSIDQESLIITEICEELLTTGLKQVDDMVSCLDELILYINRGSVKVARPQDAREKIQELKSFIIRISQPQDFNPLTLSCIHRLSQNNNKLTSYINEIISNNLKSIPCLIDEDFIDRGQTDVCDIEDIADTFVTISQKISQLKKKTEAIGLSTLNKRYRKLESACRRYNILPNTLKICCLGGGALLALYMIPQETYDSLGFSPESTISKLKAFLGEKAPALDIGGEKIPFDFAGGAAPAPSNSGLLRTIENIMSRSGITYGGLGVTLYLKDYIADPVKDFAKKKYNLFKRKALNTHNLLRGSNIKYIDAQKKEIINHDQISDELVNLEWAQEELETVINYICNPDHYDRLGIEIPKGYLFTGLPGTGKTALARWICAEINHRLQENGNHERVGFKSVVWHELIVGNGIKDVMREAAQDAPCIVFIDEIDTIGVQRDRYSQLLNEMLQELSGLNSEKQKIIIIGATNKPEHIDPALRRNGRLGKELYFPLPDLEKRENFFIHQQKKYALDPQSFDTRYLAKQTFDCSYADLREITSNATLIAKQMQRPLDQKHFQQAIHKLNGKTSSRAMTEKLRTVISTYISGRLVAHLLLDFEEVMSATIVPHLRKIKEQNVWNKWEAEQVAHRVNYGKVFTFDPQENTPLYSEEDFRKKIKIMLAGHLAENIVLGSAYATHHPLDEDKAYKYAFHMASGGIDPKNISPNLRNQYSQEAMIIVRNCKHAINTLLEEHKDLIQIFADALNQKEILDRDEINEILKQQS